MRLVVAGGRDYSLTDVDRSWLLALCRRHTVSEIVSGGAPGADRGGEECAESFGLRLKVFRADWKTHGRGAGPIRNRQMAEYTDLVALFPGGAGTRSMQREAERFNKPVFTAPRHTKCIR